MKRVAVYALTIAIGLYVSAKYAEWLVNIWCIGLCVMLGYYVQKQGPEHHRVLQKHCGFDEYSCASSFMREHAVGASKWCWLDSRDDSVDWEPPTDPNEYNAGYVCAHLKT